MTGETSIDLSAGQTDTGIETGTEIVGGIVIEEIAAIEIETGELLLLI